ncbi:hypothetical protein N1851_003771 [Merluccius polli]|uniref:Uncharacterized protein n=1 Tax=Merluccius polli TaxID=89951 RepID=A0AA47PC67_MERPO|nr:hypothetical protein N1851_003771 [Merluccius polli]
MDPTVLLFLRCLNQLFSVLKATATRRSIETDMTLPPTPRLIMLGNTVLSATKWMVSIEGRVAFVVEEYLGFADALCVFCKLLCFQHRISGACLCNIGTDTTLIFFIFSEPCKYVYVFFMRINPEEGTKCTAKTGVSRKTGAVVKRKAEAINSRVASFLHQLTEFEWKNLD